MKSTLSTWCPRPLSENSIRKCCGSELWRRRLSSVGINHTRRIVSSPRRQIDDSIFVRPELRVFSDAAPHLSAFVTLIFEEIGFDVQFARLHEEMHPLTAPHADRFGMSVAV